MNEKLFKMLQRKGDGAQVLIALPVELKGLENGGTGIRCELSEDPAGFWPVRQVTLNDDGSALRFRLGCL